MDSRPETYRHIGQVRGLVLGAAQDLQRRAHEHDASKLENPELGIFDEYTDKLRGVEYGSEEYFEHLNGMQAALDHHYAHNDHHPQHFIGGIQDMSLLQLTEMLCDWIAATRRHDDGDIRKSIEMNAERFGYGPELKQLLHNTVDALLAGELAATPEERVERVFPSAARG
jgi:hypothetical protein